MGEGPCKGELQTRIDLLNLKDKVILAGHYNPVQHFYETIDILVSPSYTEGLSNVILEAMAYKIPVVATRVGGNPEIITNQYNGLLVEPQNIKEILLELKPLAEKKQLPLNLDIKGVDDSIISDKRRVKQILINLINNAIKFTEKGCVDVNIKLNNNIILFYW